MQSGKKRGRGGGADESPAKKGYVAWKGGACNYLRFVLAKENLDSHAAIGLIARFLHAPNNTLSVAGTKDKRGVTVQHVTAHKVSVCNCLQDMSVYSHACMPVCMYMVLQGMARL